MWHLLPIKIDYSRLEILLANKRWLEADRETAAIYKLIVRKHLEEEGLSGLFGLDFLGSRQAQLFMGDLPCNKLETIDRLWLEYSDGNFGFSVQVQMIQSISSNPNKHESVDRHQRSRIFKKKVDWNDNLWFSLEANPSAIDPKIAKGYFPSDLWMSRSPQPIYVMQPLEKFSSCIQISLLTKEQ